MPHSIALISILAAGIGLALIFGFVAVRLRMPPLIGYLCAGILVGPYTPGFVADADLASQLSEIGVILLMFGVGLHFSVDDLLSLRRVSLPGAVLQIVVATSLGWGVASLWGWPHAQGIVFGLALSVASTVVLLRALEGRGLVDSLNGRIAIGWLIVEDLVMVLVLVLLPPAAALFGGTASSATGQPLHYALLLTVGKVGLFIALMLVAGRRFFPWLLWQIASTASRELFTLAVFTFAVGVALLSTQLFGVSFALGAFFAGMVLRESSLSYRAAEESLPFRDAFAVLFFVAAGMLFDPRVLFQEPLRVAVVTAIIVLGKSLAAFVLVLLLRYPLNTALTVAVGLAQIGEFSFILIALGKSLGLVSQEGQNLVLAGAILSIALNPFLFAVVRPAHDWILAKSRVARRFQHSEDRLGELPGSVPSATLTGHAVIVGYGRVGSRIGAALTAAGKTFVVVEYDRELVDSLRGQGIHAIAGDPADPNALVQAHVMRASALVLAVPDPFAVTKILEIARTLNPKIKIVARTHTDEDAARLQAEHVQFVFIGEHELAKSMSDCVLDLAGAGGESALPKPQ